MGNSYVQNWQKPENLTSVNIDEYTLDQLKTIIVDAPARYPSKTAKPYNNAFKTQVKEKSVEEEVPDDILVLDNVVFNLDVQDEYIDSGKLIIKISVIDPKSGERYKIGGFIFQPDMSGRVTFPTYRFPTNIMLAIPQEDKDGSVEKESDGA